MPRGPPPLKKKLRAQEFYCVSCRGRKLVKHKEDIYFHNVKNRRRKNNKVPMISSHCPTCDTGVHKFIKDSKADEMRRKYKN